MPIYEFRCSECGHKFEMLCKVGEGGCSACPNCGSVECKKLFSTFAHKGDKSSGCSTCSSSKCSTCH